MLYLHAMGHFNPENVISNKFLEDLDIGTTNEWIMERVGIENRRTVLPLDYIVQTRNQNPQAAFEARIYKNAQMAARAAGMALQRASLRLEDIGMIIAGSLLITWRQRRLQLSPPNWALKCLPDMNSACSSFGMQINFLSKMQPEALPDYILGGRFNATKCVDYNNRSTAVLFGDGQPRRLFRQKTIACHFSELPL